MVRLRWLMVLTCVACGPTAGGTGSAGSGDEGSSTDPTAPPATSTPGTTEASSDPSTDGGPTTSEPTTADASGTGSASSSGPGCDPHAPIDCGGLFFDCGNGTDDDGDGLIDLEDPECLGPCDDDESELPPSLPGDNLDCNIDCAFDGNSGQGDDGCYFDLRCDPLMPPIEWCGPPQPDACDDQPMISRQCAGYCPDFVPNGCDCFGCCGFLVDGMLEFHAVYDGGWQGCSLDDLGACPPCTPVIEQCGNPCEIDQCEVCIGQTAPTNCESVGCVGATPCESTCDCAEGELCHTGCCHPLPPG